jgi:hypothetical protein
MSHEEALRRWLLASDSEKRLSGFLNEPQVAGEDTLIPILALGYGKQMAYICAIFCHMQEFARISNMLLL